MFTYVSFPVSALMALLFVSSLVFLFTVGALMALLLACSPTFLHNAVFHLGLHCL